jgi:hypothetical protein
MTPLSSVIEDDIWFCRLACLSDIFSKANDSNLNLQGYGNIQ